MASPTLTEWLARWLELYAPLRCSGKTLERYRSLAEYVTKGRTPLLFEAAKIKLENLTHKVLEPALLSLLTAPGLKREHLSARSIRHIAALLRVALDKAVRIDLIRSNPMLKVDLPRLVLPESRSLTLREILALRETCRWSWTYPLVELALATGARRGELLALEWADVNWEAHTLKISKSLEQTTAGLKTKKPKNGKSRVCTLPLIALEVLRDEPKRAPLIFADRYGAYRDPALVSQSIVRRMRKAGILIGSLHTLRHTHASVLLSRGVPLPAISVRLGHADPNITARIYCHALPPDDQRAADEWDAVFRIA